MKTAMQELIDKVEHAISYNVEGGLVEKYTWTELFNDMELALKKEKEQILNARLNGFMISAEGWNGEYPEMKYTEVIREIKNEEYYNETYNQNEWKVK